MSIAFAAGPQAARQWEIQHYLIILVLIVVVVFVVRGFVGRRRRF